MNIWDERWVSGCDKLKDLAFQPPIESQSEMRVVDLVDEQGNWDLASLCLLVP